TAAPAATHQDAGENLTADTARDGTLRAADRPGRCAGNAGRHDAVEGDAVLVAVDRQALRLRLLPVVEANADLRVVGRQAARELQAERDRAVVGAVNDGQLDRRELAGAERVGPGHAGVDERAERGGHHVRVLVGG